MTLTLFQGDCLDLLPTIESSSVHLIVTSPPYADKRKHTYGGIAPDDYVDWFVPRSAEFMRVLREDGSFVLNIKEGVYDGERHPYVYELVLALRKQGWKLIDDYVWAKANSFPGWWPSRFRDGWEHCYHFSKSLRPRMFQDTVKEPIKGWATKRLDGDKSYDEIRRNSATGSGSSLRVANWKNREFVFPDNVLDFDFNMEEIQAQLAEMQTWMAQLAQMDPHTPPNEVLRFATECSNRGHSATFPVSLPDWFIRLFTAPGDVVLDPFAGSGTTGVACKALGRECIQIELLPENCQLARQRWDDPRPVSALPKASDITPEEDLTRMFSPDSE
jgi:site-specific DNA-methyltransferase (adenine-specific)/site-specific DNA-methyltransferase (cytosine-N4-specific)